MTVGTRMRIGKRVYKYHNSYFGRDFAQQEAVRIRAAGGLARIIDQALHKKFGGSRIYMRGLRWVVYAIYKK